MHGDGHGGIHYHDGLLDINGIFNGRFDLVLTNPPFGSNVGSDQKVGGSDETRVIVKSGVWGQAAFLSDSSWTCTPSLNFTLFTTNVSSANPLSRFHFF